MPGNSFSLVLFTINIKLSMAHAKPGNSFSLALFTINIKLSNYPCKVACDVIQIAKFSSIIYSNQPS